MDITDNRNDIDLTDVKVPQSPSSFAFSTASVTVNATAVNSAIVDATATALYFMQFLISLSRLSDVSTLNMLQTSSPRAWFRTLQWLYILYGP